jgi:non-canonical purine NTP pyrophosphatase (RdgB/HAM1 family)
LAMVLLLATRNAHKVQTLNDFPGAPKIVEDEKTFAGNATKKAVKLAEWIFKNSRFKTQNLKLNFVLADDSGLEVDILNGAPGIFSARFAAPDQNENSADADNNAKLLRLLEKIPTEKRTARFRCVIALAEIAPEKIENASPVCFAPELESVKLFDGVCAGKIISEPRGQNGFGYDPLFVPAGFEKTFAELGDDVKNKISHRAKAVEKLKEFFHFHKLSS